MNRSIGLVLAAGLLGIAAPSLSLLLREPNPWPDSGLFDLAGTADEDLQRLLNRIEARNQIVQSLLRKEITLLQAAAAFRALDGDQPAFRLLRTDKRFAGATLAEQYCRAVIVYAGGMFEDLNLRKERVALLETELQLLLLNGPLDFATPLLKPLLGDCLFDPTC